MIFTIIVVLTFVSRICAWLPGEHKELFALSGQNLFDQTTNPEVVALPKVELRWLPASGKIRGVNIGSLFVFEPWMARTAWEGMGCYRNESEFDCVSGLGQSKADAAFQKHWGSWITKSDIQEMQSYGLNTIRVPIGYWMLESIVYDSEHFPRGGVSYLERLCGWASDAGFYIIIDMHGAPGAQIPRNALTGQYAPTAGFYETWQYDRAQKFFSWLTNLIHTKHAFRNVGMLGVVNEPLQDAGRVETMRSDYYPNVYKAIRSAEKALGLTPNNFVHVQMMNQLWGAGDPNQFMPDKYFLAYDDHRYLKWDTSVPVSQSAYISNSCHANRANGQSPTIVGEFSLSPPTDVEHTDPWRRDWHQAFYKRWFAAQVLNYEKTTNGWIFWSWKSQLGDYRWSYRDAVAAGVVPNNPSKVDGNACRGV